MNFTKLKRESGLIELVCEHGVGHPSEYLTPSWYYYGVHGCDGCCSNPDFKKTEEIMLDKMREL